MCAVVSIFVPNEGPFDGCNHVVCVQLIAGLYLMLCVCVCVQLIAGLYPMLCVCVCVQLIAGLYPMFVCVCAVDSRVVSNVVCLCS